MGKLSVSILSSNFFNLEASVSKIKRGGADFLHMDIMDGHFVPNISYGPSITNDIANSSSMPLDIHLMIENPDEYIEGFIFKNSSYIVVHQEACRHLHRTVALIKSKGVKAGVALNPATPVETLNSIIQDLDMVLVMSVNPGFGGQTFIQDSLDKVKKLADIRKDRNLNFLIEVDGGVNLNNLQDLKKAGADIFVVGSAISKSDDIELKTREFVNLIKE